MVQPYTYPSREETGKMAKLRDRIIITVGTINTVEKLTKRYIYIYIYHSETRRKLSRPNASRSEDAGVCDTIGAAAGRRDCFRSNGFPLT